MATEIKRVAVSKMGPTVAVTINTFLVNATTPNSAVQNDHSVTSPQLLRS